MFINSLPRNSFPLLIGQVRAWKPSQDNTSDHISSLLYHNHLSSHWCPNIIYLSIGFLVMNVRLCILSLISQLFIGFPFRLPSLQHLTLLVLCFFLATGSKGRGSAILVVKKRSQLFGLLFDGHYILRCGNLTLPMALVRLRWFARPAVSSKLKSLIRSSELSSSVF